MRNFLHVKPRKSTTNRTEVLYSSEWGPGQSPAQGRAPVESLPNLKHFDICETLFCA